MRTPSTTGRSADQLGQLSPGFVAVAPGGGASRDGLPGIAAWPDIPSVLVYGSWRPAEIMRLSQPAGRLLVVGHCLASRRAVSDLFRTALEFDSPARLARLPGASSYLIIRPGELIAITDLAGQFPLFYSRSGDQVLVGMHPGVLAAHHRRAPDPVTASARIACPNVLPLWAERSAYQGIHRVAGGSVLRVRAGYVQVARQPPVPVPGVTREAGASALRADLMDAIARRCDLGSVTSDLSGGLDSTSLALLAAQQGAGPIRAVGYHNPVAPAADLAEATQCARLDERVTLAVVLGSPDTLPYQAIRSTQHVQPVAVAAGTAAAAEPAPQALAWRRSALRLAQAAAWDSQCHLTGEGGDAVLGAPPAYLAELTRPGLLARLATHCLAHARLRHGSPVLLAGRALRAARTGPTAALGRLATTLLRPTSRPLGWPDAVGWWPVSGEAAGWLARTARRRLAEIAADPVTARSVPGDAGPAAVMSLTELRHSADAQRYLRELGHRMGVAVHAPLLDNAVVRSCLQVPAWQRADPWACKPMLRTALAGVLPSAALERRSKGDYTAEDYRGARGAAARLRDLLRDSRLADLGVLEPAGATASLDRLLTGAAVPLGELNNLLATELWLRDRESSDTWSGLPW